MKYKNKFEILLTILAIGLVLTLYTSTTSAQNPTNRSGNASSRETSRLAREIRHELLTLPWYGVFDWLEGTVAPDGTVTLRGWVVRPTTKSDAAGRVKEIEGVSEFRNEIQVLPLSPNDDRLRRALYNSLFNGNSQLFRYALGANPSIHIIVNNGRVTLKGVVSSEADSNYANIKARGVSGVFEVKNELMLENAQSSRNENK